MTAADVPTDKIAGVVLAGGRSRRFGQQDKPLADLDGSPMLAHVVERLSVVTDEVVVNCRVDQRGDFDSALADHVSAVRFAVDDRPDQGPLAGLGTALREVEREYAIVLGCDMPLVDPASLRALLERIQQRTDAVVPTTPGGPALLHAIYRVSTTGTAVQTLLNDGERRLQALHEVLATRDVDVESSAIRPASLTSVDTPSELSSVARARAVKRPNR